ncbi:MAG: TonB family protein [Acidobacteria bacterium]|nr:TonB family protein [Acidobacteriota bacterium]
MLFREYAPRRRGALPSFLTSLGLHSLVVLGIWTVNPTPSARFPDPTLADILEKEQRQITWYTPKAPLPAVAPAEPAPNPSPAKLPRYQAPQRVVADNANPLSDKQMILGEAPEIEIRQDQDIPNMVSWTAPKVEQPRYQPTQPKLIAPPRPKKIELEKAPEIQAANPGYDFTDLEKLPALRYRRDRKEAPKPQQRSVEAAEAPQIQAQTAPTVDPSQFESVARLRYQGRQRNEQAAPSQRAVEAEQAPEIAANAASNAVAPAQDLPRLRYQDRQAPPKAAPRQTALDASGAPILRDAPGAPGVPSTAILANDTPRLRYQSGDGGRPAEPAPRQRALADLGGAAPHVGGGPASAAPSAVPGGDVPRLRYQGESAPGPSGAPRARALGELADGAAPDVGGPAGTDGAARQATASLNKSFDLPGAPPPSLGADAGTASGGTGGDANLLVVGVNPSEKAPAEPPRGSRSALFAAGPDASRNGGQTSSGDQMAALRAPNLSIRGDSTPQTASPRRQPGDTAADDLRKLTKSGGFRDMAAPPPQIAYKIDAPEIDIEHPFVGRPVYTVAINMPNVTSYRGDWVIQFAEWLPPEEARKRQRETPDQIEARLAVKDEALTPPQPSKKVDPRYVADAVRERVEGEVVLYGVIGVDGSVQGLQVLRSLDKRLDLASRAAIAQWVFEPARKRGQAVPVEVLVRIPFRLDPNVKVRY